jgi:hypothetical protein
MVDAGDGAYARISDIKKYRRFVQKELANLDDDAVNAFMAVDRVKRGITGSTPSWPSTA